MTTAHYGFPLIIGLLIALEGCTGLFVPNTQEFYHTDPDYEWLDENKVVNQVECELHKGVLSAIYDPYFARQPGTQPGNDINWLSLWGAKVTFTLTVDEKGSLNPGITFFKIFSNNVQKFGTGTVTTPQSFSLGAGLQASSDSTRKEIISYTLAFSDLLKQKAIPLTEPCENEDEVLIHSDLKIGDFIRNKINVARVPGSLGITTAYSPYTAFSDEVTFVVIFGGNVNPMWKFIPVSFSTSSSPLISSMRTKTQDILITLGLIVRKQGMPPTLSDDANAVHSAGLIGQAVSTSNASQTPP